MRVFISLRVLGPLACALPLIPFSVHAQSCPDYTQLTQPIPNSSKKPARDFLTQKIELSGDDLQTAADNTIHVTGNVEVNQGERKVTADAVSYNTDTQNVTASGTVSYKDEQVRVSGTDANMSTLGGASFDDASFELLARSGRGTAKKIQLDPDGNLSLDKVTYTSCPADHKDWELTLSDLDINQDKRVGTGRNVRLDFKGIPILYTPYISFPVGNERKTGVLFPSFGSSSRGGYEFVVPWYWNLAPNYDATFMPTLYTSRGFALGSQFRYLLDSGKGTIEAGYLPYDKLLNSYRDYVQITARNDFTESLRLDIDAGDVSDNKWFEDFGQGPEATSSVYLTRLLRLSYLKNNWLATLSLQNLQIIDSTFLSSDPNRPYTLMPYLAVHGEEAQLPYGLDFLFDGDLAYFTRREGVTGGRLSLAPEFRMPLRTGGMYVEPAAGWRYIAYQLSDPVLGINTKPSVAAPVASLDSGLVFERYFGSKQQRLQTLEPRLLYVYAPYRNQDDQPIFDTTLPDLNLVQLFRTDRYVGGDRLGDANQLSVGVTSRMFDARSGKQYLSATVGQAFYFTQPRVLLPTETPGSRNSSDIIAQLALSAYKNWNVSMGVQWNPEMTRTERGNVAFQYAPAKDRVINLGYSYQRDPDPTKGLEQFSSSFAWPINPTWSAYGKVVYSKLDSKIIDRFAGFQYRSCCWNVRLVAGRSVSTRTGESDTSIRLQLELSGLSSVGVAADTFLERSIPGYSARQTSSSVSQ